MPSQWFCRIDKEEVGPISSQQLLKLARAGQLTANSPVRKSENGNWVRAGKVKGLFDGATSGSHQAQGSRNLQSNAIENAEKISSHMEPAEIQPAMGNRKKLLYAYSAAGIFVVAVCGYLIFTHKTESRSEISSEKKKDIDDDNLRTETESLASVKSNGNGTKTRHVQKTNRNPKNENKRLSENAHRNKNHRKTDPVNSKGDVLSKQKKKKSRPLVLLPKLGSFPSSLAWPESHKERIERAIKNYRHDPFSLYFIASDALTTTDVDHKITGRRQKAWLAFVLEQLRPYLHARLKHDFDVAIDSKHLRSALFATEVLDKLEEKADAKSLKEEITKVSSMLKVFQQLIENEIDPVWRITNLNSEYRDKFVEHLVLGTKRTTKTFTAPTGSKLLYIRARIENISASSDPTYVEWTLQASSQQNLDLDHENWDRIQAPKRLASATHMYLFTDNGASAIHCLHVCNTCEVLLGGLLGRTIFRLFQSINELELPAGSYIGKGQSFEAEVLFLVPDGSGNLKFLFLGSPPVELSIK